MNVGVEKQAYLDNTLNHCQAYVMINFTSRQSASGNALVNVSEEVERPDYCFSCTRFHSVFPLYRSVFGEDALVNVSVEKQADGKLAGFIRIRSKTQARAVSGPT